MNCFRRIEHLALPLLAGMLVGCGGGGGGSGDVGTPPAPPPVNRAPVLGTQMAEQVATVGLTFTLDATRAGKLFTDPDGDPLSYVVIIEGGSAPGLAVTGTTISGTPTDAAECTVTINVDDGRGGIGTTGFLLHVKRNEAPSLGLPIGHVIVDSGAAIDFDPTRRGAAFVDPENQAMTYTVSILDGAPGFTVQGTHVVGQFSAPGYLRAKIAARDGLGATTEDIFALVVPSPIDVRPQLPASSYVYEDRLLPLGKAFDLRISGSIGDFDTVPLDNPITNAGATLGRVLFYDKRLSITNTHACSSCHEQSRGFASSVRFPRGALGVATRRSPMALANVRFNPDNRYFSDERSGPLEELAHMPIVDPDELGNSMSAVEQKLAAVDFYPPLFQAAFGSPDVTGERITRALAQFLRSLITYHSKFDAWRVADSALPPDPATQLTEQESRGEQVFIDGQCFHCHMTPHFEQPWPENNGIDAVVTDPGTGEGRGKFRVASLRNVAVTGPYMHDGRFATLRDVIDHYSDGIKMSPNLSIILGGMRDEPRRMNLSEEDKAALEAFLNTLTDNEFLIDPRFSDPFR